MTIANLASSLSAGLSGGSAQASSGAIDPAVVAKVSEKLLGSSGPIVDSPGALASQVSTSASRELMESAAKVFSQFLQASGRDVGLSVDADSGSYVIRVTDSQSGNLVRQIPTEEALALMRYFNLNGSSVLVSQRA